MATQSDYVRAEQSAASIKPRHSVHMAGLMGAGFGFVALLAYLFATWSGASLEVAGIIGLVAAYVMGCFDAGLEWKRYWRHHDIALNQGANKDA